MKYSLVLLAGCFRNRNLTTDEDFYWVLNRLNFVQPDNAAGMRIVLVHNKTASNET